MATTLQDLYAHPLIIEKVERPIKARIMSWKFETGNPQAVNPSNAAPIAVSLDTVKYSGEDEERIQGEVVVSSRIAVRADITTQFTVRSANQLEDASEKIAQDLQGFLNFSLPLGWQGRDVNFVADSAQVALNDLRRS
ncbi:MAG TPA: hypothetical protein VIS96_15710 [Terrimicrobiaceae bacterium]